MLYFKWVIKRSEIMKILKITKNRGYSPNLSIPYGLLLDEDALWFETTGAIDENTHVNDQKAPEMKRALDEMQDEFDTSFFEDYVTISLKKSRKTAFNWLAKMEKIGQIEKLEHGRYLKVQDHKVNVGEE